MPRKPSSRPPMIDITRPMTPEPGRIQKIPKPMPPKTRNARSIHQGAALSVCRVILNVSMICRRRLIDEGSSGSLGAFGSFAIVLCCLPDSVDLMVGGTQADAVLAVLAVLITA